jgi:hypothetical protein
LTKRQRHIVGFASADEESNRANPILVLEGDPDEIIGGSFPIEPADTLVQDRGIRGPADGIGDLRVGMAQGRRGVAGIDNAAAILELKPDPTGSNYARRRVLAERQARRQKARFAAG